ncbi:MAG: hypothetical protein JNL67_18750 [Planctomycetaceae bacterium]|nr:hypothetical protein [Planctomycetaceae bacterium]
MTSISASEYWEYAMEIIRHAMRRPSMYFKTLNELEALMGGHAAAFQQLRVIERDAAFSSAFSEWIMTTTGESCAAGWAYAIEQIAMREGNEVVTVFQRLAKDFDEWRQAMT